MGEQAGSGFPKMLRAWMEQHWQYPNVEENTVYETTTLYMPTISLFPEEIQYTLSEKYKESYTKLDKDSRLALILAFVDKDVSNHRLSSIGAIHPADSSKILRKLVENQFLVSDGVGRGTRYHLNDNYKVIEVQPKELEILNHDKIKEIRESQRTPKKEMQEAILWLCKNEYKTKKELAIFLNRDATTIGNKYLTPMVKDGLLKLKYEEVNHKDQAYKAKEDLK